MHLQRFPGVSDLNAEAANSIAWVLLQHVSTNEPRQDAVCASHGLPTLENLPSHGRAVRCRSSGAYALECRAVSRDGLRPADLSGESARHRDLPECSSSQALSHGLLSSGGAFDIGRCQRAPRLAAVRRFRAAPDQPSAQALCAGQLRRGTRSHRLRPGCHDHRSVSVGLPLGAFPLDQGGNQAARCWICAARFPASFTSPTGRCTM